MKERWEAMKEVVRGNKEGGKELLLIFLSILFGEKVESCERKDVGSKEREAVGGNEREEVGVRKEVVGGKQREVESSERGGSK